MKEGVDPLVWAVLMIYGVGLLMGLLLGWIFFS